MRVWDLTWEGRENRSEVMRVNFLLWTETLVQKIAYLCIMMFVQRHTLEQDHIGNAYEGNCFAWRLHTC